MPRAKKGQQKVQILKEDNRALPLWELSLYAWYAASSLMFSVEASFLVTQDHHYSNWTRGLRQKGFKKILVEGFDLINKNV